MRKNIPDVAPHSHAIGESWRMLYHPLASFAARFSFLSHPVFTDFAIMSLTRRVISLSVNMIPSSLNLEAMCEEKSLTSVS